MNEVVGWLLFGFAIVLYVIFAKPPARTRPGAMPTPNTPPPPITIEVGPDSILVLSCAETLTDEARTSMGAQLTAAISHKRRPAVVVVPHNMKVEAVLRSPVKE